MGRRWVLLCCLGTLGSASPPTGPPATVQAEAPPQPVPMIALAPAHHARMVPAADYHTPEGELALVVATTDGVWVGGQTHVAPWTADEPAASEARRTLLFALTSLGVERAVLALDASLDAPSGLALVRLGARAGVTLDLLVDDPEPTPQPAAPLDPREPVQAVAPLRWPALFEDDRGRFTQAPPLDDPPVTLSMTSAGATTHLVEQLDALRTRGPRLVSVTTFDDPLVEPRRQTRTPAPLVLGDPLAVHRVQADTGPGTVWPITLPELAPATIRGGLDPERVRAAIHSRADALAQCMHLDFGGATAGDVVAHLRLGGRGMVAAVELRDSTLPPAVNRCAARVFASLAFESDSCSWVTVEQPVHFPGDTAWE